MNELYIRSLRLSALPEDVETYLRELPAVCQLQRMGGLELHSRVTFFVGENGTGKSTLLEAIAVAYGFNPEGGSWNFSFSTKQSHSKLSDSIRFVKGPRRPRDGFFLRAESFYNVASYIDRLDEGTALGPRLVNSYGGRSLHEQSHGESFLSLVLNRFGGNGLYILDEPEAALSPTRQMSLLTRVHQLSQAGSQLIIATHSPILTACPGAEIYELTGGHIRLTPYEQTENYMVTREFLNRPRRMLGYLLSREDAE